MKADFETKQIMKFKKFEILQLLENYCLLFSPQKKSSTHSQGI